MRVNICHEITGNLTKSYFALIYNINYKVSMKTV